MSTPLWPSQRKVQELNSVYDDSEKLDNRGGKRERSNGAADAQLDPPRPKDARTNDAANEQIDFPRLIERLTSHVTAEYLQRNGNIDLTQFKLATESITKPVHVGGLSGEPSVQSFKEYGIALFDCSHQVNSNLYKGWKTTDVSSNDGRKFQHYKENKKTWSTLPYELKNQIETFIVNYFGKFDKNKGQDIVGVSNLIITPDTTKETPVIQKLHLDHMWGAGNEVVVAIDVSGKALRTRYFTGSHDNAALAADFNRRHNRPHRDLGNHREQGVACNAQRVADLLIKSIEQNTETRYTEANTNGMIFDAGGLHSGNAVVSDGPRVFWTFRTNTFHTDYTRKIHDGTGERELAFQDTWFPMQPDQHIKLGSIDLSGEITVDAIVNDTVNDP